MKHLKQWLALAGLSTLLLSGCQSMGSPGGGYVGAGATLLNTVKGINVLQVSYDGQYLGGMGGETCCVRIPAKWYPGMTATVEWTVDPNPDFNPGGVEWPGTNPAHYYEAIRWSRIHKMQYVKHRAVVPVPRYDEIASLNLVFLPCNQVVPVIDEQEYGRVFGSIPISADYEKTIQQRLGATHQCQQ